MTWAIKIPGGDYLSSNYMFSRQRFTIHIDFYRSSDDVSQQCLFGGLMDNAYDKFALVLLSNNKIRLQIKISSVNGGWFDITSTQTINVDELNTLKFTFHPTTDTPYIFNINGIQESGTLTQTTGAMYHIYNTAWASFKGWTVGTSIRGSETGSTSANGAEISRLAILRDSGVALVDWIAEASDRNSTGSQPVLTDTVGSNDAIGFGLPTDGSAWINYTIIEEIYNFSAAISITPTLTASNSKSANLAVAINQAPQITSTHNKKVSYINALAQTVELSSNLNKKVNQLAELNQTVQLSSALTKNNNLTALLQQNYQQTALKNKTTNVTGHINQTVILTGYFSNSLTEVHQFSATITIKPTTSATVNKKAQLNSQINQTVEIAGYQAKTTNLNATCAHQVTLNGQATKQTNLTAVLNQPVQLTGLFINTAQPIHLHQFTINGAIVFQRFNGATVSQRFNGALH